jgi:lysophospholipase L1-like esterase
MNRVKKAAFIVLVNVGVLAVLLAGAEVFLRVVYPCDLSSRSLHWWFVPGVGNVQEPHSLVRDTNRFDFCVEQRANSLGFLDAEPPPWDAVKDKLRIALVGDSFVEAVQVAPSEKVQQVLAQDLAAAGIDASVVAWGSSGFGTVQELALFKRFGLSLHPNVVVLVIVHNDLKNNSWLLQALFDGVFPDTPFNVEIRPASEAHAWTTIDPMPIRQVVHLPHPPDPSPPGWAQWLMDHSTLYAYGLHLASWNHPRIQALLMGMQPFNPLPDRIRYFSGDPQFAPLLAGWPLGEEIDDAFERRPWSPVLDLAVTATEHVMDQWVDLARREHFKIIALLTGGFNHMPAKAEIWRRILEERSIPAIWFDFAHEDSSWHFLRDGHWNAQGHRWAARLIADFLIAHRSDYLPDSRPKIGSVGR